MLSGVDERIEEVPHHVCLAPNNGMHIGHRGKSVQGHSLHKFKLPVFKLRRPLCLVRGHSQGNGRAAKNAMISLRALSPVLRRFAERRLHALRQRHAECVEYHRDQGVIAEDADQLDGARVA